MSYLMLLSGLAVKIFQYIGPLFIYHGIISASTLLNTELTFPSSACPAIHQIHYRWCQYTSVHAYNHVCLTQWFSTMSRYATVHLMSYIWSLLYQLKAEDQVWTMKCCTTLFVHLFFKYVITCILHSSANEWICISSQGHGFQHLHWCPDRDVPWSGWALLGSPDVGTQKGWPASSQRTHHHHWNTSDIFSQSPCPGL